MKRCMDSGPDSPRIKAKESFSMLRALSVVLSVLLLFSALPALAEECFVMDFDALDMARLHDADYLAQCLTSPARGLRVRKYISDSDELAARVRLTVTQADDGSLISDKDYGYQSGVFDSDTVYLPYVDNRTIPYIVTLYIEDWVYAAPFLCSQPRLNNNGGCLWGVRMRDYDASLTSDWQMGAMLDLDAMRAQGGVRSLPICASNLYVVGQATIWLDGDALTVSLAFDEGARVELHSAAVYCVRDVSALTTADPRSMPGPAYAPGDRADVSGARTVLLYVPMTLSYDPQGLPELSYDLGDPELQRELDLWRQARAGSEPEQNEQREWAEEPQEPEWSEEPVPEELETPQTNG